MNWLPHDLGTWGFILSILAFILMYPIGLLINLTTPLVANWLAAQSRASLNKRIQRLEGELAELEKYPTIDETENELLWRTTNLSIRLIGAEGNLAILILAAVWILGRNAPGFKEFATVIYIILVGNVVRQLRMRYRHDFRYKRSPDVRPQAINRRAQETPRKLEWLIGGWPTIHA